MHVLLALLTALVAVAAALGLWWRSADALRRSRVAPIYALLTGALLGTLTPWAERAVLGFTGLDFQVRVAGAAGALMAAFLLAAPLEEAAKVLVVWPLYRTRRLATPRAGVAYAGVAGAGFAAGEGVMLLLGAEQLGLTLLRVLLGTLAHVFFAGCWGFALGAGRTRGRWFSATWIAAVVLHGLYDHIVWGRGPGYISATAPMLAFMALGTWFALRDRPAPTDRPTLRSEPRGLREVREALNPAEHPVMMRWVLVGAFVTLGLIISLAAASVFVGHRIGIDFTLADEADVRSAGPLALLGTGVILAFPVAGYLIARASSAHSVLEPALATLVALAALVVLLVLSAPVAVLFALALTPIAVGLACGGAWLGIDR